MRSETRAAGDRPRRWSLTSRLALRSIRCSQVSTPCCQGEGRSHRAPSQDNSRYCMEGAASPLQAISHIELGGQEADSGSRRNCARALRLCLGDWPGGKAGGFIVAPAGLFGREQDERSRQSSRAPSGQFIC
jgi:hypothetical protein